MSTNRSNDEFHDKEHHPTFPTLKGTVGNVEITPTTIYDREDNANQTELGLDSAAQDNLHGVIDDEETTDSVELANLPALREVTDVGQGGRDIFTSDIPELNISHSVFYTAHKENSELIRAPPVAESLSPTTAWTAINEVPVLRASQDGDAMPGNHDAEGNFEDSTGCTDGNDYMRINSADIEERSALLDAAEEELGENNHAMYEDIGVDRKYFDPDYFLRHTGMGPVKGFVRRIAPGSKTFQYILSDHTGTYNFKKSAGQEMTPTKTTDKKPVEKAVDEDPLAELARKTESNVTKDKPKENPVPRTTRNETSAEATMQEMNGALGYDEAGNQNSVEKPKRGKPVGFHEDEEAWFTIFHEKIKRVINSRTDIDIPIDSMVYKSFNVFFEGKVLQDADGNFFPPRVARAPSTVYNHLHTRGPAELVALRNEVSTLLGDSSGGQLYVPIVTDEEIRRYLSDGTVTLDDINDAAKNHALSLSEKDIQKNQQLRKKATNWRKRKGAAQASISSSSEQESPNKDSAAMERLLASSAKPPFFALQPKEDRGTPLSFENVPSSPPSSDPPAAAAPQETVKDDPESDAAAQEDAGDESSMEGDGDGDGALATAELGVDNSSDSRATGTNTSYIEPDPFWKQQMDVIRKRRLFAVSSHGLEDVTEGDVTDHGEQDGRPAKKVNVDA
ncbi:hypothetical protein PMIN04_005524 [Paraphaeosphaeria minitans]